VHACVAYDVTQTSARMYSGELGLLPIDFFVTFDNFRTIGRCQLAWRRRDHIGVVFEGWVDVQAHVGKVDLPAVWAIVISAAGEFGHVPLNSRA
jgi:hypothetical protein